MIASLISTNMEEYAREPCPWRIVDDCGGAFTMGVIGGGVFQAIKGFRNAPGFGILLTRYTAKQFQNCK
uniref:Mitochondrial import inner membrane translocase subunit Tim17-B n=1 Tax=Gasterosteus aculeatus aculeatus TaxID=481459 RepID=A0AAQ4PSE0_GASAC